MIDSRAEQSFANGRRAMESERYRDAVAFFKGALELTADRSTDAGQARYLSYYGLALCLSRADCREALRCCRRAAAQEPERPELWWNLGRVALAVGHRGEAHRSWSRGIAVDAANAPMRAQLQRMGTRRSPVLSFLSRTHPINVTLGRLRSRCIGSTPRRRPAAAVATVSERGGSFVDERGEGIVGVRVIG